jgi:hypothetical protein
MLTEFDSQVTQLRYIKASINGIERTADAAGLNPNVSYTFKVVGRNSLGDGPESEAKTIKAT